MVSDRVVTYNFNNLNSIRGGAAAVVLVSHVIQIYFLRIIGLNTPLHKVSSLASEYAVVVFFILSGYLIAHTLESNIDRNGKLCLRVYAAARFARLYPVFLYSVAVSIIVFFVMDVLGLPGRSTALRLPGDLYAARDFVHLSPGEIKTSLLMLQGMLEINGPLWSLYMEAKLYVLFACALALLNGQRGIFQKLILILVFYYVVKAGIAFNPSFSRYAVMWLTGALAYYICNRRPNWGNRIIMCMTLISAAEFWQLHQDAVHLMVAGRDILVAILISWMLFKLRIKVPGSKRLADCSYSLYVTHFPVLLLGESLLISTGSASIGTSLGVAIISTAFAYVVALLGGAIEVKKSLIQNGLLKLADFVCRLRLKTS